MTHGFWFYTRDRDDEEGVEPPWEIYEALDDDPPLFRAVFASEEQARLAASAPELLAAAEQALPHMAVLWPLCTQPRARMALQDAMDALASAVRKARGGVMSADLSERLHDWRTAAADIEAEMQEVLNVLGWMEEALEASASIVHAAHGGPLNGCADTVCRANRAALAGARKLSVT